MRRLDYRAAAFLFGSICFGQNSVPSPGWVVISLNEYATLRVYPPYQGFSADDMTGPHVNFGLKIKHELLCR